MDHIWLDRRDNSMDRIDERLQAIFGLFKAGRKTIEAAMSLRLMSEGYRSGLIRFGLIAATK